MKVPKVKWVDLFVTESCNLDCKYCFHKQKSKNMTIETVNKTLDVLDPILSKYCTFNFFGGEPTLREDFILEAIQVIRNRMPESRFFLSTNGLIFSSKIGEVLKEKKDKFQISYDGLDQDILRGESQAIRKNILLYMKTFGPEMVSCRMTFTPETVVNLVDNIQEIYNLGFRDIMHSAEYCDRWTEEQLKEYEHQLDLIYEFIKDKPELHVRFADCNSVTKYTEQCQMGKRLLAVSADGSIYPCHRAIAYEQFKIGDVWKEDINRGIFLTLNMEGCEKCEANGHCHSCYITNYEFAKSLQKPLQSACAINITECKKAVKVYDETYGKEEETQKAILNLLNDILTESKLTRSLLHQ